MQTLLDPLGRAGVELSGDQVSALAIHAGGQLAAAGFADHRVGLPVAEPLAKIHNLRPFFDANASGNLPAFGGLSVRFSTRLAGHAEIWPERLDALGRSPKPPVDRRVADCRALQRSSGRFAQAAGDLLGRPTLLELLPDVTHERLVAGFWAADAGTATGVGLGLRDGGKVAPVGQAEPDEDELPDLAANVEKSFWPFCDPPFSHA